MPRTLDDLKNEALLLDEYDRFQLVAHLLDSLPDTSGIDPEIDATWADEVERRHNDFVAGSSVPIPAELVFEEIEIGWISVRK
ncbi:MAG: addiction module protein [Candidatus Hydrogenedentes bacterium]|nr:addiction module protein [Candidatus Hydrogenedentota bacterium]